MTVAASAARSRPYLRKTYWMTSSRRSCSKSTSMSGGSLRSSERKRSNSSAFVRDDRGDAEAIADGGIGRGAAALAEDRLFCFAGKADDVVHSEEIRFVFLISG